MNKKQNQYGVAVKYLEKALGMGRSAVSFERKNKSIYFVLYSLIRTFAGNLKEKHDDRDKIL